MPYTSLHANDLNWILTKAQQNIHQPKPKDRTALETVIGYHFAEMERLTTQIILEYLKDSTGADSVTHWMHRFSSLDTRYALVDWLWQIGGGQLAMQELNTLPNNYPELAMGCRTCNPYLSYKWLVYFKNLLNLAEQEGRNLGELTVEEVQLLQNLANQPASAGIARQQARNILHFFYQDFLEDVPTLPELQAALRQEQNPTEIDTAPAEQPITEWATLEASPNPAQDWIRLKYNIDLNEKDAVLVISSIQGVLLHQQPIEATGALFYDSKHLPSGIYFATLKTPSQKAITVKFTVIH